MSSIGVDQLPLSIDQLKEQSAVSEGSGKWGWWAGSYADVEYEGAYTHGEYPTREEAIADFLSDGCTEGPDHIFYVVEARLSDETRRSSDEGDLDCDDSIPFAETRNKETLVVIDGKAVPA